MKTEGIARTSPNLQDADTFYECLLNAHSGLSREASELLNARLILIMANQLGDSALLQACIALASQSGQAGVDGPVE